MALCNESRFTLWLGSGVLLSVLATCNPSRSNLFDDPAAVDGAIPPAGSDDLGPRGDKLCGADKPCPTDHVCYQNRCVPSSRSCCSDKDCLLNDSHCSVQAGDGGVCGGCISNSDGDADPLCIGEGFSAYDFKSPADRCSWPPPGASPVARDVVMTPVVIDLDLDGQPEIIFAPQNGIGPSRLVAMRGKDCSQLYDVAAGLQGFSQLAVADLDGDGYPEIVGLLANGVTGSGHQIAVFNGRTGAKLAQSGDTFQMTGASFDCSGPAIADLDGDGSPELIAGGLVVRWNKAMGRLDTVWNQSVQGATWGSMTLVNDLDGDGKPEVISGNKIFDGASGHDRTPSVMASFSKGTYDAIGDFNRDGAPDLVLVQSDSGDEKVAVVDVKNNVFLLGPLALPSGWGGPPTVADFDGDGFPDFGTAGPRTYHVFSLDCLKTPKPAKCRGAMAGVLWQAQTKDVSSGGTASSVFDFNGDGRAEVVYRDECWLRVYNGPDGKTVFARAITSGTALEMPIVADVDNDGHADLVVASDSIQGSGYCSDQNPERDTGQPHTGVTQGVFVLKDPMNRWMPSRPLWNQHSYHITNISDDGSVPASELPNWLTYNDYRQNVQGKISMPVPQPDATSRGVPAVDQADCGKQWKLSADICNRGAAPMVGMLPGTFYTKDPRVDALSPICTAYTKSPIQPGKCETVDCLWQSPPSGSIDLWFRPDDDGKGARPQPECKNDNDLAFLPAAACHTGPG